MRTSFRVRAAALGLSVVVGLLLSCIQGDSGDPRPRRARPEVYLVTPTVGGTIGGDLITIFTRNFQDNFLVSVPEVRFGSSPAFPALQVIPITPVEVQAVAPAGVVGVTEVTVVSTNVFEEATCAGCFTYVQSPPLPPCTITGVAPSSADIAGGELVRVFGSDFGPVIAPSPTVFFGSAPSTSVLRLSEMELEVLVPPAPSGSPRPVVVRVDLFGGGSCECLFCFTYTAQFCLIDRVTPGAGFTTGGDTVVLDGFGFPSSPIVEFGGVPATNVTVSPTGDSITCTTPPATGPGPATVGVSDPISTTSCDLVDGFLYADPAGCAISGLAPAAGSSLGGELITVLGVGFDMNPPPTVEFVKGGAPVASPFVMAVDSARLLVQTPSWPQGERVDVVVTNPSSGNSCSRMDDFEFLAVGECALFSVTPPSGPISGGNQVILRGAGLVDPPDEIIFGSTPVPPADIQVLDSTTVLVTVPGSLFGGIVDVIYVNPGPKVCVAVGAYSYANPTCTITGVTPANGAMPGGNTVLLDGTDFPPAMDVRFGGVFSPSVTVLSSTQVLAVVPPSAVSGVVDIIILGSQGTTCVLPAGYTYDPGPGGGACTVTGVTPAIGAARGGETVTITGTGFEPGPPGVLFGLQAAASVIWVSADTLTVTTPRALFAGFVDVTVVNRSGAVCTLPQGFEYEPLPVCTADCALLAVVPNVGPVAGGIIVDITGFDFCDGAKVYFGTEPVTVVSYSGTVLTVITPPCPGPGPLPVVVLQPNGFICVLQNAFTCQ